MASAHERMVARIAQQIQRTGGERAEDTARTLATATAERHDRRAAVDGNRPAANDARIAGPEKRRKAAFRVPAHDGYLSELRGKTYVAHAQRSGGVTHDPLLSAAKEMLERKR